MFQRIVTAAQHSLTLVRHILTLIIIVAGFVTILFGTGTAPSWVMPVALALWVTVAAGIATALWRGEPEPDRTIKRQRNVVLRWLVIFAMVPLALFVLLDGWLVQYIVTGALAVISPALPFWAFLFIASLWAIALVDGFIRAARRQL